jgi:hypothetical protein
MRPASGATDSRAARAVSTPNLPEPHPAEVQVANKSLGTLYLGNVEVTVLVEAADFRVQGDEWARFVLILRE